MEPRVASQDDADAVRQRPADRVIGAPSHDERLSHGERAHAPHVVRESPGKSAPLPDDVVAVEREDERDARQTAIFALIGGWCWYRSSRAKPSRSEPGASPRSTRAR